MGQRKLILIDGLPGSGKSTTAQYLALQLQRQGRAARWFYEEQEPHPLHRWQARDRDDFAQQNLANWQAFVEQVRDAAEITILESTLFQRINGVLWVAYEGVEQQWLAAHYRQVQAIIAELEPALIYFTQHNVTAAMRRVFATRGEQWTAGFIALVAQAPYSQQQGWRGLEGTLAFLQAYRASCDQLLAAWPHAKLELENSEARWEHCYQQILEFLGLLPAQEPPASSLPLAQLSGRYLEAQGELVCTIHYDQGQLAVDQLWWPAQQVIPLLPLTASSFAIRGAPVELTFEPRLDNDGWQLHVAGSWGPHMGKLLQQERF